MKLSAILVRTRAPLSALDAGQREFARWLLTEWFHGIDEQHDRAWRNWLRPWWKGAEPQRIYPERPRNWKFHQMHMAVEGRVFDHQDAFYSRKAFTLWVKTGACFGQYEAQAGQLVFVPASRSYDECSDDEMREYHHDAIEFLRTPQALDTLWPDAPENKRLEILELVMKPPPEDMRDTA